MNIEAKNIIKSPFKNTEIFYKNNNTLNGIPTPKDIKIDQKDNKLLISWNIETLY